MRPEWDTFLGIEKFDIRPNHRDCKYEVASRPYATGNANRSLRYIVSLTTQERPPLEVCCELKLVRFVVISKKEG